MIMNHELLPIVLVLVPMTASAAASDLRTGLIPNRLVAIGLVAGCLARAASHALPTLPTLPGDAAASVALALAGSGLGVCICGAAPYVLFRRGAMGGGDVKLLGAVGAAVGPALGIRIELLAFVLAALYIVARLALERRLGALLASTIGLVARPFSSALAPRSPELELAALRFGPAIFAATLLVAAQCWSGS
jgi:prepilin peptidase CpaA